MNKRIKVWVYASAAVFIVVVIIAIVFAILESRKSAALEILVAPLSAEVKIDGKSYKNGTYRFEPGEVNVVISKEGFRTEERTLKLEPNTKVKLYTYILPLDGSFDWYLEHEEDAMILTAIGDAEADADSTLYLEKYPIINVLPIIYANYDENWNYTEFRIDGGMFENCERDFCLKITDTTGGNYEKATKLIVENGYEPNKYEILYEYKPIVPLE